MSLQVACCLLIWLNILVRRDLLQVGFKFVHVYATCAAVQVHGLKGLFVGVMPRVGRRALQQAFAWYNGALFPLQLKIL